MEEIKNCKRCGIVFRSNGFVELCPLCFEKDQHDYNRIKQYLIEHPCTRAFEVSTVLDISMAKIKRYLREDRLQIVEANNRFLDCEICGKPIKSGKLCDDCFNKSKHDFKTIYIGNSKAKQQQKLNYHFYNSDTVKKVALK